MLQSLGKFPIHSTQSELSMVSLTSCLDPKPTQGLVKYGNLVTSRSISTSESIWLRVAPPSTTMIDLLLASSNLRVSVIAFFSIRASFCGSSVFNGVFNVELGMLVLHTSAGMAMYPGCEVYNISFKTRSKREVASFTSIITELPVHTHQHQDVPRPTIDLRESTVAQRVVHNLVTLLDLKRRIANNLQNQHILAISSRDATERREFPWTVRCDECTDTIADSSVAVSWVRSVELVRVSFPVDSGFGDEIEEGELVVYVLFNATSA